MKDKRMKYDLSYNIMQGGSNQEGYQNHPSEHYINKALTRKRKRDRSGKGNKGNTNSGSNRGNFTLGGISKLTNPPNSSGPSKEYLKAQKRAAEEAKKKAEELEKEFEAGIKGKSKTQKLNEQKKRNRAKEIIKLAELNEKEQEDAETFIEAVLSNEYSKQDLMKNFCKINNENIRDNIVVNAFIPKYIKNIEEIKKFLNDENNLDVLEKNYYEFEAHYSKIFKVFFELQLKFYNILKVQINLKNLSDFFTMDFSELDEFIKNINENGFNFEIVKKLQKWIDQFKKIAGEKFKDLNIESLQKEFSFDKIQNFLDIQIILERILLRKELLKIKEELTINNFTKIMGLIAINTHQDIVVRNIIQLKNVLTDKGNIKTFYEKYEKGYFTDKEKDEVKKLVEELGKKLEPLKLKYDEDIKVLDSEKEENISNLENDLAKLKIDLDDELKNLKASTNNSNKIKGKEAENKKKIDEKIEEINEKKEEIEIQYIEKRKMLKKDYDNLIDELFNNLTKTLQVIHKNAIQKLNEDSIILKEYLEFKKIIEEKTEKEEKEELQKGGADSFKLPTEQIKEKRRQKRKKAKQEKKAKREQNSVRMAANAPTILEEKKDNNYKSVFNEIPQNQPEQPKPSQSLDNFEKQLQDITTKFKSNLNSLNTRKKQSSSVPTETMAQKLKRQEQKRKANALTKASEEQKKTARETWAQKLKRQIQKNKEAQEAKNYEEIVASERRQSNANADALEKAKANAKQEKEKINRVNSADNTEYKRKIMEQYERMKSKESKESKELVVRTEKNFLPFFVDAYIKFFYPLEFILAEYNKIITNYNELFTKLLNIKDKLYFYIKIYNRLKSKNPSKFSCTFAYISFQILYIDEIIESFKDSDFIVVFRDYCKNTLFVDDLSANASLEFLKQQTSTLLLEGAEIQKLISGSTPELSGKTNTSGALVEYSAEAAAARERDRLEFEAIQKEREAIERKNKIFNINKLLQEMNKKISNKNSRKLTLQELRNIRAMKEGLNRKLQNIHKNDIPAGLRNYLTEININKQISDEERRLRKLKIAEILDTVTNLPNNTEISVVKKKLDELITIKQNNIDILTDSNNERINNLIQILQSIYSKSTNSSTFKNKLQNYEQEKEKYKNSENLKDLKKLLEQINSLLKIQGISENNKKQLKLDKAQIKRRIGLLEALNLQGIVQDSQVKNNGNRNLSFNNLNQMNNAPVQKEHKSKPKKERKDTKEWYSKIKNILINTETILEAGKKTISKEKLEKNKLVLKFIEKIAELFKSKKSTSKKSMFLKENKLNSESENNSEDNIGELFSFFRNAFGPKDKKIEIPKLFRIFYSYFNEKYPNILKLTYKKDDNPDNNIFVISLV